ncbi:Protein transport protein sec1 [Babesia microti strain RI]|uniref:Protein transport protein sec1 n=1 Tax=Babesia microti (strain RI) TaxID=1133968 RepID=I7I8X7_BABMR|nr:Protein transport protein sec1 [Babesia microti strain RI]CCF73858.1 Protein transport protein sec1 [Babesia microti strain RI]|eukprot:XP_012648467.1 Protein transport protein sec1 [Babesia microti strain RI]
MRERSKRQLLWAIKRITDKQGPVLMIVDGWCLRILSSCCSISDVLELGVAAVEFLETDRQPMKNMSSLYFLSDLPNSITLFINDFKKKREKYKSAFLLFNCHLKGSCHLELVAKSVSLKKISGCYEILLDFIPYESKIFLTSKTTPVKSKDDVINKSKGGRDKNIRRDNSELELLSQLNHSDYMQFYESIFSVLELHPNIRYQCCDHLLPKKIAEAAQSHIYKNESDNMKNSAADSTFLVLCRCNDLNPLFLHEYTYQAFTYDTLNVNIHPGPSDKDNKQPNDIILIQKKSGNNESIATQAFLSEGDDLWVKFRHEHLQKVNQTVLEEVNRFSKERDEAFNNTDTALDLVRSLPQLQQMVDRYWIHVTISEMCFNEIEKSDIMRVGNIEQDLATGVDKVGKSINASKSLASISSILTDEKVDEYLKARLIMLYAVNISGLSSSDIKAMISGSSFSPLLMNVVTDYLFKSDLFWLPPKPLDAVEASGSKYAYQTPKFYECDDYYKRNRNYDYELSRFQPNLYFILKKLICGKLSYEKYPCVKETATRGSIKKFIVYVCGGVTFSETRVIYSLCKELNVEIYLGGDTILVPKNILKM